MEKLYAELAEYFVFDKQKYSLEEFFSDIKTFKDQFKQAYDSIIKERESEAKLIRAREEREKAERVSGALMLTLNMLLIFIKIYFMSKLILASQHVEFRYKRGLICCFEKLSYWTNNKLVRYTK